MTSHNSSLCVVVDAPDASYVSPLVSIATDHIREHFFEGSDPGLCVVEASNPVISQLALFGLRCTYEKVSVEEAVKVAEGCHLSGHGGTNMGMIGAAAAVGLTWKGDSGRFVDWKDIRELDEITTVEEITARGITLFSVNRHGEIPAPGEMVNNYGSLRPRLFCGRVILPVISDGAGCWNTIIEKRSYSQ